MLPNLYEDLLPINPWSRPGWPLECVLGIVTHWTQPPSNRSTLSEVRQYWRDEGKLGHYGSAAYIIDQGGDICRVVPELEITRNCGSDKIDPQSGRVYTDWARKQFGRFANNWYECPTIPISVPTGLRLVGPNACTIGVEMIPCDHITGRFTDKTLDAGARLCAYLLSTYTQAVLCTHQMVVGYKDCPRWFVNNPGEWLMFGQAVEHYKGAV